MLATMSVPATPSPRIMKVIELSGVERATSPCPAVAFADALRQYCSLKLAPRVRSPAALEFEACSRREGLFLPNVRQHPFIEAVHRSFAGHYPLVLSPHAIWLLIAQALASHINANSDELRPKVVGHHGKLELLTTRNDFVRGCSDNPWPEVFDSFAIQIRQALNAGIYDLIVPRFSMTTDDDVAVTQIVLMDAVQTYFSYMLRTFCGIPQIRLEGSAGDWEKLLRDARALDRFDLHWWTTELVPVLEQFVAAANDDVDKEFWGSLYKYRRESGGPYVNGWINVFFPYLNSELPYDGKSLARPNLVPDPGSPPPVPHRRDFDGSAKGGTSGGPRAPGEPDREIAARYRGLRTVSDEFPTGLSVAPFKWDYYGTTLDMRFVGGFVGVCQEPETLALRPELGWCVVGS